jgi:hypothetical protein
MKSGVLFRVVTLSLASSVLFAGNIALTGHDDDLHQSTQATAQALAMLTFARAGAPTPGLPVLTFDAGSELTGLLTSLGISFVNINPNTGVPAASNFDVTKYSAFAVASDTTCGGCDNNSTSSTNLAADSAAIASFFNAGGGIVAFAGASNSGYYNFLPASASNPGIVNCPAGNCFTQTAAGAGVGITAVNTDFPHNFFAFPGTSGMDPTWKVAETFTGSSSAGTLTNQPSTVFIQNATITSGGFGGGGTPEPGTYLLLLTGLAGLAVSRKRLVRRG